MDQARAPKPCKWCKKGEGLNHGCTTKGNEKATVICYFMVSVSSSCGEVQCEEQFRTVTGVEMADIVDNSLEQAFQKSGNSKRRIF